jgi:ethanolamine utilization microcompartment shell protein EutS
VKVAAALGFAVATVTLAVASAQQAAPPAQPESPYRIAGRLPVRIMSFDVQPKTIKPGEKVTLTWAVENPTTTTIDPIGRVAPRGVMTLTPSATTTYALSVTGPSNSADKRTVTVVVQGTTANASASDALINRPKTVPRTADGHPDFSGVYGYGAGGGGRGAAPAPAAPGSLPTAPTLKPGAEKFRVVRGPEDTGLYSTCMPPGIPQVFFVPYYLQIVQAPKHVVIAHEYLNQFRIIPTDGRPHQPDPDPSWNGNAVARWEGDTLVIDSIGYNDKTEINGYKHTESLHIVERISRPDVNTLKYEATIEDPNVFAGPWMIQRTFPLLPEYDSLNEFVCENNRDYKPLFGNK